MFATYDGQTTRPPVAWCSDCTQFQLCNPYVLCLTDNLICVYNLYDSKLKQEIHLPQTKLIKYIREENILILATQGEICALKSISISAQIDQLLSMKKVDEALSLFECCNADLDTKIYVQVCLIFKVNHSKIYLYYHSL